ncbi:MAG: hypothetical protein IJ325_06750 [Clostridia bacterium]|nr:hypothetical protein [Clostridia bacterium]
MKKCIAMFLFMVLLSAGLYGCSSDVPEETLETKPTIVETKPAETEPPVEETEPPVDVETAQALLAERLAIDANRLTITNMAYTEFSDTFFTFDFTYSDSVTYAPLVTSMNVKMVYTLDSATGEWTYDHYGLSLGDIENMDYLLGEWFYEEDYSLNIKDISDKEVTYDYCIDGVSGTATSLYALSIDGRAGGYNGVKLILISPAACEQLFFFSEAASPDSAYWCIDNSYEMVRPSEEIILSERAQLAIDQILSYYKFMSLSFEHIELQYDRDLPNGYHEVCIHATTTAHAPLEVTYSLVCTAVNLGYSSSYDIVDIKNLYIMEGTWEYNDEDVSIKFTTSNADMDGIDIAYEINGAENKQHCSFAEIVSNYSQDDKYFCIPLSETIEGYDLMYCISFNDRASAGWYIDRDTRLNKVN